jgi:hypothetical protein
MKRAAVVAGGLALGAVALACAPTTTEGTDAGPFDAAGLPGDGGLAQCWETAGEGTACVECLSTQCSPQWNAVQTTCTAYLACVCPNGMYDASAEMSQTCMSIGQGACATAVADLTSCEIDLCAPECGVPLDAGGDGPSCTTGSPCGTMGQSLQLCTSDAFCYAQVGASTFACDSCTDTTSCMQQAMMACP